MRVPRIAVILNFSYKRSVRFQRGLGFGAVSSALTIFRLPTCFGLSKWTSLPWWQLYQKAALRLPFPLTFPFSNTFPALIYSQGTDISHLQEGFYASECGCGWEAVFLAAGKGRLHDPITRAGAEMTRPPPIQDPCRYSKEAVVKIRARCVAGAVSDIGVPLHLLFIPLSSGSHWLLSCPRAGS